MTTGHSLQALESLSTFTLKGLPSACVAPNFGGWGLIRKVFGIAFFQKGEVWRGFMDLFLATIDFVPTDFLLPVGILVLGVILRIILKKRNEKI